MQTSGEAMLPGRGNSKCKGAEAECAELMQTLEG